LERLSLYLGNTSAGALSSFLATDDMFFPFLACEVVCTSNYKDNTDVERRNAHNMALAVRGVVELFQIVGREKELNGKMLAFSISHSHEWVYICGCYPVIEGSKIEYERHCIYQDENFADADMARRWIPYTITRNIYERWMPAHLARLRSAMHLLPPGAAGPVH
jgi:hypothetical protein